jgi:sterol desaturase/sphingolipid hydroxylase (fatty acid hydroxylase superfamily)
MSVFAWILLFVEITLVVVTLFLMSWSENTSGIILFCGFFLLYGLEFLFPLVPRKSRHLISNLSFAFMLTVINLLFTSITLFIADWIETENIGLFNWINASRWVMVCVSIVLFDLWAGYVVHCIFHKYAWLWHFHSIHHTDDLVDVTTTFRQHPVESVIRISFHISGMVLLGVPAWVLLAYLTLSTIVAQIEHANILIPARIDKWLQYIIVTPNMHKVHHSKYQHETDSNYSNIFSFWDRLFQTYKSRKNYRNIEYGLDYIDDGRHFSFFELLKLPFVRMKTKD